MARGLTKKQKGFVKDYIKTGNATESAMRNYDVKNRNVANNIGAENLAKPSIENEIKSIADSIPDELLIEKHLELLNVPKIVKTTKMGEYVDTEESTDVQAIKAGLDMAYKLKGSYAPEKREVKAEVENKVSDMDLDRLAEEMAKRIKEERTHE